MSQTCVVATPRSHVMSRRQRHGVERQRPRLPGCPDDPAPAIAHRQPRYSRQRSAAFERLANARQRLLAIVHDNGGDLRRQERFRTGCRGVTADEDRHLRGQRPHALGERQNVVCLERVHRRDANELGPMRANVVLEGTTEAEIGEDDAVPARFERRRDVLHAERLDAEKGAKAEALVARHGPQQENLHRR